MPSLRWTFNDLTTELGLFRTSLERLRIAPLKRFINNCINEKSSTLGVKTLVKGWIKLNSDGACKNNGELFECGELIVKSDQSFG